MQYHLPLSCFFHFINKRKIQKQQLSALTAIQMKLDGHHRRLDAITEPQDIEYLYMFLTLGPNENTWSNKGFYFRYVKNSCMLMEDLKRRLPTTCAIVIHRCLRFILSQRNNYVCCLCYASNALCKIPLFSLRHNLILIS